MVCSVQSIMYEGIFDSMLIDSVEDLHRSLEKRGREALFCPVCRRIAYEPLAAPCHHIFCTQCISDKLRHDKRCPVKTCRRQAVPLAFDDCKPLASSDPGAERVRGEIQIRCRLFGRGCRWNGLIREFTPHQGVCRYRTLLCPNKGCGEKMERRFMNDHAKTCRHRKIVLRCPFCGGPELALSLLQHHVEKQCPAFYDWVPEDEDWFWLCPSIAHAHQMSEAAVQVAKTIARTKAEEEGMRMNRDAAEALLHAREVKAKALAAGSDDVEAAEEAFVQATVHVGKVCGRHELCRGSAHMRRVHTWHMFSLPY